MKNNNQPPPWSEAPPWAMWRAQDEPGAWYFYEEKPVMGMRVWIRREGTHYRDSKAGSFNSNWRDTLQKRPENE